MSAHPTVTVTAAVLMLSCATDLSGQQQYADPWLASPVDDATFQTFRSFFVYDARLPLEVERTGANVVDGVRDERLSFQSTPGVRVTARYLTAVGRRSQRPTVILLHGGSPRGKDSFPDAVLSVFVRGGVDVLAIDMLYFGERATGLLTTFTEQDKHDNLYNQPATFLSWIVQTVKDAGRAFDLLVELGVDPARIGLVGYSRGGQVGLIVGGVDTRLRAVAAIYAGHFDRGETGHLAPACPANYIGRIAPRPLYLFNGRHDSDYLEATSVQPLHRLARELVTIVWVETGHQMPTTEDSEALVIWLRERLGAAGG